MRKMKNKIEVWLNVLFIFAIILSSYTLIKVYYLDKYKLLQGICPVRDNRTLTFISIGILFLYFVLSALYEKKNKNSK